MSAPAVTTAALSCVLATLGLAAAPAVDPAEAVIAEVGPEVIRAYEVVDAATRVYVGQPTGDTRRDRLRLLEPLIAAKLLVAEAVARGFETPAVGRELRRFENDRLVAELERVEIRERVAIDARRVDQLVERRRELLRSQDVDVGDEELRARVEADLRRQEFGRRQAHLLEAMKEKLHYTPHERGIATFIAQMRERVDEPAGDLGNDHRTGADSLDRFGFTTAERALPIFTYDGTTFTIGDYADCMSRSPREQVEERVTRERIDRDLEQYFRHLAYADVARDRGYLEASGVRREVRRYRERLLVEAIEKRLVALPAPPGESEVRAYFERHRDRYVPASEAVDLENVEARVRRDLIAELEEQRFERLVAELRGKYPVRVDEAALSRLPL